jgi:DNA-binding Lrp family transcriptional regulator
MAEIRLTETDKALLDALHDGRNVPSNLAEDLDLTRQHIQKRLKRLEEHGYIRNIGRGVYELVEDPRE